MDETVILPSQEKQPEKTSGKALFGNARRFLQNNFLRVSLAAALSTSPTSAAESPSGYDATSPTQPAISGQQDRDKATANGKPLEVRDKAMTSFYSPQEPSKATSSGNGIDTQEPSKGTLSSS